MKESKEEIIEGFINDSQWHEYNPEMGYIKHMMCVRRHDGVIICGWPNAGKVREIFKTPQMPDEFRTSPAKYPRIILKHVKPPYAYFSEITHYRLIPIDTTSKDGNIHFPPENL